MTKKPFWAKHGPCSQSSAAARSCTLDGVPELRLRAQHWGGCSPLLARAGLGMAAPPRCCCIRGLLRNMLLARKGKKHHDFMEKFRHERSRGTEREGFIQKQICNQNQVRRHSQKLQENRRNQNKTVRAGKNTEIKEKGTRGEAREAGNLLQN